MTAIMMEALDPQTRDAGVPAHFGDPVREQRALTRDAGLVDRSHRGVLAVPGADRLTWLHSITTQHLTALRAPSGTELLVLSPHGHVEHHAMLTDDGQTAWLDVEPGTAPALLDFLARMRFMMRVEPADVSAEWAVLSLLGPGAGDALARLGVPGLAEPQVAPVPAAKFASATVEKAPTSVYATAPLRSGWVRRTRLGYDLLVPRAERDDVVARLDVPPCGLWAYEALRVAAGIPRLGWETDHRTIPAECTLDTVAGNGWLAGAVHLDKGCYRGQETVARVHNLGRPPRRLVLLHLDGITTDELPAPHTPVTTAEGREVGFVGTAVRHFELGMIALAMVKRTIGPDVPLRVGASAAAIDG